MQILLHQESSRLMIRLKCPNVLDVKNQVCILHVVSSKCRVFYQGYSSFLSLTNFRYRKLLDGSAGDGTTIGNCPSYYSSYMCLSTGGCNVCGLINGNSEGCDITSNTPICDADASTNGIQDSATAKVAQCSACTNTGKCFSCTL